MSRRVDLTDWGICGYRHCAKPVPPPLRWCRPSEIGGRDCWHKEHRLRKREGKGS